MSHPWLPTDCKTHHHHHEALVANVISAFLKNLYKSTLHLQQLIAEYDSSELAFPLDLCSRVHLPF